MLLTATSRYQPVRTICARPEGVVSVGLVDLQAQRGLGVPGIEADDGNAATAEIQRQPIGELAGLKPNPDNGRGVGLHRRCNRFRGRSAFAAPDHGTLVIDDANRRGFE
jgi:hypothetical protein